MGQLSEREEYLDDLLKEMDDKKGQRENIREDGTVDKYEKDLEGINEEDFLKEFEKTLGETSDTDIEAEISKDSKSDSELEQELGLDQSDSPSDFMDSIGSIVNDVKSSNTEDTLGDGDLPIDESLKNFAEEDPDLDGIGQEFNLSDGLDDLNDISEKTESGETEDISEAERLARKIEGLNLDMGEEPVQKATNEVSEKSEEPQKTEEKGKKKGFFARLSAILFGEEEEEGKKSKAEPLAPADIENLSEEELSALRELEGQTTVSEEDEEAKKKQEKAEQKKAEKEQKAQEKAEKKAEKKAAKEQKAKEKAEKKALKLQNQEPVVKSKPLPKKPVILIVLCCLSLVVLINLLSGLSGYNAAISDAKDYYQQGEYVSAFNCLDGKEMKKADKEFYEKAKLNAYLQQQIESYNTYQSQSMYNEALAALICGVGRYDRFIAEATTAGVDKEYNKMLQSIEEQLNSNYQMSVDDARAVYALDDKKEFTYAVADVINKLGLEKVEQ